MRGGNEGCAAGLAPRALLFASRSPVREIKYPGSGKKALVDHISRPGVLGLCQPVVNIVEGAGVFEGMREEGLLVGDHVPDFGRGPGIGGGIGEVGPVVGEDGVNAIGDSLDEAAQEVRGHAARDFLMQFDDRELRGAIG